MLEKCKKSSSYMLFCLLTILICVIPLLVMPWGKNAYEYPKFLAFLIIVETTWLLFVVLVSFRCLKFHAGVIFDSILTSVTIFCIISLIADLIGIDPKVSLVGSAIRFQGFITLFAGFQIVLLLHLLRKNMKEQWKYAVSFMQWSMALSALSTASFAFYQAYRFYIVHDFAVPTYLGRIVGTFGFPNALGGYFAMLLPLFLFIAHTTDSLMKKCIWYFLSSMSIAVIFVTQSRGALIAAACLLIMYVVRKLMFEKYLNGLLLAVIVISFIAVGNFAINFSFLHRQSHWDDRSVFWKQGIEAVMKRPILGYGQENFELIIPPWYLVKVDNAHNIFLEILSSSGIIGLFCYCIFLYFLMKKASVELKMFVVSFLIVAQFNPLSIAQISLFWFVIGFV